MNGNTTEPAIEIHDLRKSFRGGRDQVLRGVNLRCEQGRLTFLLGSSGAGKSVLLKHMLGLLKPDDGGVRIQGRNIPYDDPRQLNEMRKLFGMSWQYSALFDDFTVFENVSFPLVEHSRLSKAEMKDKVAQKLEAVGLDPSAVWDKLPNELSGGMRKRVALARAIILEPTILLYDEPTTGLDPMTRNTVDELIRDTNDKFGLSSVVISHDMYAAVNYADHLAFLHKGEIVFYGSPTEFEKSEHPMVKGFLNAEKSHVEGVKRGS